MMGFNFIHTQLNGLGPFQMNPRFTFNGSITGNALADLMLGVPATMLQGNGQIAYDRMNMPSLYVQDNWRLTRSITVDLGLRWDPFYPQHHIENMVSIFEPDKFYQGVHSTVFPNALAGFLFHGDSGFPGQSDTSARVANFSPRLGVVYDPRGKGTEVIRVGYGLFYDSPWTWMMSGFPQNSPWGESITLNTPAGGLSNPWLGYPGGNPFPTPTPPPANFQFPVGGSYVSMPLHVRPTYVQQWNIALEKQFGKNWRVSATYMGNKTSHLWLAREINPAVYVPGTCSAGQYGLAAAGACSTAANVNQRRVFYLANPAQGQLLGSVSMLDDGGNADYSGLLLAAQHRFSDNFSALANYTWSHCLGDGDQSNGGGISNQYENPNNRSAEYGNCVTDRRQIFNASLVAQSPRFVSEPLRRLAGGWRVAGIFTASTGAPLNVTVGSDNALAGEGTVLDRPNLIGNPAAANPTILQWFNTAAFAKAPTGSYGNLGRDTITGPGQWNLDLSLSRGLSLGERSNLEFRVEVFNVMNHARLGNPATAMSSALFGQINTAMDPRIMQGAVKFTF
jgi:TonB dependent receptor